MLIVRRTKFSASSWLILRNNYIQMRGQENVKIQSGCCTVQVTHDGSKMMDKEFSTVIDSWLYTVYVYLCNIYHCSLQYCT